jgi:hypothetical protein
MKPVLVRAASQYGGGLITSPARCLADCHGMDRQPATLQLPTPDLNYLSSVGRRETCDDASAIPTLAVRNQKYLPF